MGQPPHSTPMTPSLDFDLTAGDRGSTTLVMLGSCQLGCPDFTDGPNNPVEPPWSSRRSQVSWTLGTRSSWPARHRPRAAGVLRTETDTRHVLVSGTCRASSQPRQPVTPIMTTRTWTNRGRYRPPRENPRQRRFRSVLPTLHMQVRNPGTAPPCRAPAKEQTAYLGFLGPHLPDPAPRISPLHAPYADDFKPSRVGARQAGPIDSDHAREDLSAASPVSTRIRQGISSTQRMSAISPQTQHDDF
jgi:hypothetical protein